MQQLNRIRTSKKIHGNGNNWSVYYTYSTRENTERLSMCVFKRRTKCVQINNVSDARTSDKQDHAEDDWSAVADGVTQSDDGWGARWWVTERKSVEPEERNGDEEDRLNSVTGEGCGRCWTRTLTAPPGFFSICWCWPRRAMRLTCTGMGTTSFCGGGLWWWEPVECCICWWWCASDCDGCWWLEWGPPPPNRDGPPVTNAALTRFHLARRFWNQILIWTSDKRNWCAICERSVKLRYFLAWNSRSNSINWCVEKAVLRRRFLLLLLLPPPPRVKDASMEPSDEVTTAADVPLPIESLAASFSLQSIELRTAG